MLIEIVSNCAFSLELRRKKLTTMVSIQWHIKLPHVFKGNEETEKKDLLFGVHRFRSIFAFNKLDLYNSYLQRPKDSAALFFLLLRQNKSQYITCNFQSNKARYYWTLTTYQKKNHFVCIVRCSSAFYLWTHMGVSFQFVHHQVRHFKIRNGNIHWKSI